MSIEIKISKRPISYEKAINFLKKRVENIKIGKRSELLWVLEHPTVYTAGIRAEDEEILDKKLRILKTNRGGKITIHNPGQKIIYFAINLNERKRDIRNLINIIEKSIIEFLKLYDLKSYADKKNIGIWVNNKKIAAIGIKVTKWIAYHGCSINIDNDLSPYKKIKPCGLNNDNITSLFNEKKKKVKKVNENLKNIFYKNLKSI